ncbi:hypothetical protein [Bacillus pseudomycoides]|uniref:hypothetical protein n=1 Tax=Bacillus pseudomycoides TaxID=64104 RepID=UPI001482E9DB|nr:hypothetical protein [Bacillus pseudomycoides]MED1476542.1 hypothetical protein [Bacillus pseudomycoides]
MKIKQSTLQTVPGYEVDTEFAVGLQTLDNIVSTSGWKDKTAFKLPKKSTK